MRKKSVVFIFLFSLLSIAARAYVGPGAGFAFVGSFFFIFIAFFVAFFNLLTFPLRALFRFLKRMRTLKGARYKRVIIIGFDGMDYHLFNQLKKEGIPFPNFDKIASTGLFSPLLSSEPPISPVAWSTFATGVNPGKHNIFDFLTTDRNTYMPKISLSEILPPKRQIRLGKIIIPLSKPRIELKRKSQSFWKIVSSKGIFSSVLRVPYTFPPEKFYGVMLAGLGTPDLRGTQGSYSCFSEKQEQHSAIWEGLGEVLEPAGENVFKGTITGPGNPFVQGNPPLRLHFQLEINKTARNAIVTVGKEKISLKLKEASGWTRLEFKAGFLKISGIAQWVLEDLDPVRLYLSPINLDPESPSMPLSQPKIFSVYLAKQFGPYATLGMAEDTTALNERVLSEEAFIQQVYQMQAEREKIFFDSLRKTKNGLIVQVFEATDRIQHMFWRYLDHSGSPADCPATDESTRKAIANVYQEMDHFLGRLDRELNEKDLLLIVSDHGFNAFNRGFHLNSWLFREGYLALKEGKKKSDKWYADVDWSKTRAYGQGLNGIFLNMKGREKFGIVKAGSEAAAVKDEIQQKLKQVKDDKTGQHVVKEAFKREDLYQGPYTENAPDIIVGYNKGYRVSWESAVNFVGTEISSDNTRMWSGDHAFTRDQVPGIFFCNKKIGQKNPSLLDISPTVLAAFGIQTLPFIEGRNLEVQ